MDPIVSVSMRVLIAKEGYPKRKEGGIQTTKLAPFLFARREERRGLGEPYTESVGPHVMALSFCYKDFRNPRPTTQNRSERRRAVGVYNEA